MMWNILDKNNAKVLKKSKRKPNKLWDDQGRELHNNLIQKCLDNSDILMYATHNKGNSFAFEKFIRNLKGKICKKRQLMIVKVISVI